MDGIACSDSTSARTSRHHEFIAIFVPDCHYAGEPGVELLIVFHKATLGHVVLAVYHTDDRLARFDPSRNLQPFPATSFG